VFDNAERREDIERFIPLRHTGHVLITSWNPDWQPLAGAVPCTGSSRPSWRHTAATAGPGVKQGAVAPDQVRCGQGLKRRYRSRHRNLGPEDSDLTIQAAEDAKARLYGKCRVPG
jgi:hypothetical protein